MSKARSMYAGSSGSNYGVNKNSPGNGNGKWQGLPPITNMRSLMIPYVKTRARGDNRDVVFCMNQLGGVGKISNMFATTADGVQDCKNGKLKWTGPFLPKTLHELLKSLDKDNNNFITTSEAEQSGYGFLKDFDNDGYLGIEDYRRNYDLLENNYNLGSTPTPCPHRCGIDAYVSGSAAPCRSCCSDSLIDCEKGPENDSILHYFNIYAMDMTGYLTKKWFTGGRIWGWLKNERVGNSNHITCSQHPEHKEHNKLFETNLQYGAELAESLRSLSCQGQQFRSSYVPDNYGYWHGAPLKRDDPFPFSRAEPGPAGTIVPSVENLVIDPVRGFWEANEAFLNSLKYVSWADATDEDRNLEFSSVDQPDWAYEYVWRILGLFTVINSNGADGLYLRLALKNLEYGGIPPLDLSLLRMIFKPGKYRPPTSRNKHFGYKLVVKTGTKENPNIPSFIVAKLNTNDATFVGRGKQLDGTVILRWKLNPMLTGPDEEYDPNVDEPNVEDGPLWIKPHRIYSVYFDRDTCPDGQRRSDINEKCRKFIE